MFGAEETARVVKRELLLLPEVSLIVGEGIDADIHFLPAVPRESGFPCVLTYPRITSYEQAINGAGEITTEIIQFEVRFIDNKSDATRIRAAARAQLQHFNGKRFDEVVEGRGWTFQFQALGEVEMPHLMEGTDFYSQRGTIYDVTIYLGG